MNELALILMAGGQGQGGGGWQTMIMILLIIVIFYFFMIRPQNKRNKEERQYRESLQKGQKVVTLGGVHGKIVEVKETTLVIEIANGVNIEIERTAISVDMTKSRNKA